MSIKEEILKTKRDFKQMIKKDWLDQREKANDYVQGRTKEYTMSYMNDQAKEEVPIDNNNTTKRVIERISLVYSLEPKRKYYNGKTEIEELPNEYNEAIKHKNEMLHRAEKRTNLLRLIAIKPTLRDGVFDYEILEDFEPHFGKDQLNPIGISYPLATRSEVLDSTPELWCRITEEDYIIYNRKTSAPVSLDQQVFEDMKNPYEIVPIVWVFDEKPQTSFLDIDPANDLIMMNEAINAIGTCSNANVIYQSYGYTIFTGIDKKDERKIKVGPNVSTFLGRDTTAAILSPPDTLNSVTENIKAKMTFITANYHLPQGFVLGEERPESGIAIQERNKELQDERKGDVIRWRNTENALYEVEKVIVDKDLKKKLPDKMVVDFSETMEILSPQEQREKDEWDLEHGLITEAEILMRRDPDGYETIEKAQKKIDINKGAGQTEAPASLSSLLALPKREETNV